MAGCVLLTEVEIPKMADLFLTIDNTKRVGQKLVGTTHPHCLHSKISRSPRDKWQPPLDGRRWVTIAHTPQMRFFVGGCHIGGGGLWRTVHPCSHRPLPISLHIVPFTLSTLLQILSDSPHSSKQPQKKHVRWQNQCCVVHSKLVTVVHWKLYKREASAVNSPQPTAHTPPPLPTTHLLRQFLGVEAENLFEKISRSGKERKQIFRQERDNFMLLEPKTQRKDQRTKCDRYDLWFYEK